jgi:hypothetical protein
MFVQFISGDMCRGRDLLGIVLQTEGDRTAKLQYLQDWLVSILGARECNKNIIKIQEMLISFW